jgi:hypothetical protein
MQPIKWLNIRNRRILEFSSSDEDDASASLNNSSVEQLVAQEININRKKAQKWPYLHP